MTEAIAVSLRAMASDDIERVAELERLCFTQPWSPDAFLGLLRRRDADLLVAESQGRVVGYAVAWAVLDQAELGNLAVAPAMRRNGIASALLGAVLDRLRRRSVRELFLEVRHSNLAARRLYEGYGFVPVARRARYYTRPPEDALVLRYTLSEEEPDTD